jgi:hypothetical protein
MAAMQKTFQCLNCKASIKLERDQANSKWKRFELDGVTEHKCGSSTKKQQHQQHQQPTQPPQQQQTVSIIDNSPQIAELAKQILDLKNTIDILITQIQLLRSDVKSK